MFEIYELELHLHEVHQGEQSISDYYSYLTRLWQQLGVFETHNWTSPEDDSSFRRYIEKKGCLDFCMA